MSPDPANDDLLDHVSMAAALTELNRVQRLIDESHRLLREIEWGGSAVHFICPACRADKGQGHERDCALARAIGVPTRTNG